MSRPPMSAKQLDCYNNIKAFITKHGYSPTRKQVAELMNVSQSMVQRHMLALQLKGYIMRADNQARSIVILDDQTMP